jgi:hypothetical protein
MAANPNGSIAVVFTYAGTTYQSYADFLAAFWVTLPGGDGVALGPDQYYGYTSGTTNTIALGASYSLQAAASPVTGLLPTNAVGNANLAAAFSDWASSQAASPGQTSYANLYLSSYTGGRIYLSNGALGLGATGEPVPAAPTDNAYALVYDLFEPFIGAQVGNPTIPGNLADITDIDWFSFPITLKVWYYDFSNPSSVTLTNAVSGQSTVEQGGSGADILSALQIGSATSTPTNAYPNKVLPVSGSTGSATAFRVAGPTAAATSGYYTDPATDLFPYHYFDDYLSHLATTQGSSASLFSLTGSFAGVGDPPYPTKLSPQQFSFAVDFSGIKTTTNNYPSGAVEQITPGSVVVLSGYTFTTSGSTETPVLGSAGAPFTITIPWAKGASHAALNTSAATEALGAGWLSQSSPQTAPSGTYTPIVPTALDKSGNVITPDTGSGLNNLMLVYSLNTDPGTTNDLWQGGSGGIVSVSLPSGLQMAANATVTKVGDSTSAIVILATDQNGGISTIAINDFGGPSNTRTGSTWTFPPGTTGLNNTAQVVVTLDVDAPLRSVFVLSTSTFPAAPAKLSAPLSAQGGGTFDAVLEVLPAGLAPPTWVPDTHWTTLDQPAGIYGANTGYTIAGLTGADAKLNGAVKSLKNDVFGWVVADLLAALNVGFVGSPVLDPDTAQPIGQSPSDWFTPGNKLYGAGLWGAKAWEGQSVDNFWNTWAYNLSTVPGGTDAYGFAFTDRFTEGILIGFSPPPPAPSALAPVLLEVIVGDSPLLAGTG